MANEIPMIGVDKVGFVIACADMVATPIEKVRAAAKYVGFDADMIKDIRPRNAFIRAARNLVKQGVLEAGNKGVLADRISDESETAYQFSSRQVENGVAKYPAQAVIHFNKTSEAITVEGLGGMTEIDRMAVHKSVMGLFEKAGYTYTVTDLNSLLDRMYSEVTRRIMLRPAVYFVPVTFQSLVFKTRDFLAALGMKYHIFVIGASEQWAIQDVFDATAQDVCKKIAALRAEIAELAEKKDADGAKALTSRMARNRFKEIAKDIQHYRDIARALKVKLEQVLAAAGEDGRTLAALAAGPESLVRALSSGNRADPLAAVLTDIMQSADGKIMALAARINGKAPQVALAEYAGKGLGKAAYSVLAAMDAGVSIPQV